MRLCHILVSVYIIVLCCCGGIARAETTEDAESSGEEAPPRVLLVVLPLTSSGETALGRQIIEATTRAGLEPNAPGSGLDVSIPTNRREELERLEEEAAQHELALELDQAAASRRAIVELLEEIGATATHPTRLAEALSRLAATEVEAERIREATQLWQRALALRSDLTLDGTFSPSAREAFEEARRLGATLPPRPDFETLERLCRDLDMAAVLWVAAGMDEGNLTVVRVLHRRGTSDPVEVRHTLPTPADSEELVLSTGLVDRLRRELSLLSSLEDPYSGNDHHSPPPPPLYRRWWFWFTIGMVVAGGATAAGLIVGLGEDQVDVRIEWP